MKTPEQIARETYGQEPERAADLAAYLAARREHLCDDEERTCARCGDEVQHLDSHDVCDGCNAEPEQ